VFDGGKAVEDGRIFGSEDGSVVRIVDVTEIELLFGSKILVDAEKLLTPSGERGNAGIEAVQIGHGSAWDGAGDGRTATIGRIGKWDQVGTVDGHRSRVKTYAAPCKRVPLKASHDGNTNRGDERGGRGDDKSVAGGRSGAVGKVRNESPLGLGNFGSRERPCEFKTAAE